MIFVTREQIDQLKTQLADDPIALRSLEVIEDCEGDVEDAAITLALRSGQEPDRSDDWLAGLAKRWRTQICQLEIRTALEQGTIGAALQTLRADTALPPPLALPVVLYALDAGIDNFCKPLQEKL